MKYALTVGAAVILLVAGRAVEDRWHEKFDSVQDRLDRISRDLNGWEGRDLKLVGQQASWAQLGDGIHPGYIDREYVHAATGRRVTLLLVWGRPDPVSQHTPEQCYPSAGFEPAAERERLSLELEPSRPAGEFFTRDFAKTGPDPMRLRIYWTWNADGKWQAPDEPHEALARHRQFYTYGGGVLFKLYVIREVTGGDDADGETCQEFLREVLPEFRRQLFPET
jgi:hypothetical protein